MSWNYGEAKELRQKLANLTHDEREALTWETAAEFVPHDTMMFAIWQGELARKTRRPIEVIEYLLKFN